MRFLIVITVLACALAEPDPAPALPIGQRIEPTLPTISAGDINGAFAEAQAEVADTVRAAIDVDNQIKDKVSEVQGQAINNVEEEAWRVVDTVKTVEARLDGAAAGAAPIIAKNFVRGIITPGVNYAIPQAYGAAPVLQPGAPVLQPGSAIPNVLPAASVASSLPSVVRPVATASPSVQATAPVPSVVAAPASFAPASYAPASYAPASYAPASYAPASYAPASYAPASYARATYAPAAYAPATYAPAAVAPAAVAPAVQSYSPYAYNPYTYNPYVTNPYAYNPYGYATNPYGYDSSVYTGYPGYLNSNPYLSNPYYQGLYNSPLGYSAAYYKK